MLRLLAYSRVHLCKQQVLTVVPGRYRWAPYLVCRLPGRPYSQHTQTTDDTRIDSPLSHASGAICLPKVEHPPTNVLFVYNVPAKASADRVKRALAPLGGSIKNVRFRTSTSRTAHILPLTTAPCSALRYGRIQTEELPGPVSFSPPGPCSARASSRRAREPGRS